MERNYKERSKFWAFVFSFVPGAGEMYLGLKRKGTEMMILCFGIFAAASLFRTGVFTTFIAVIWFYSFFDTMDLSRMSHEERMKLPDKFIFSDNDGDLDISISRIKNFIVGRRSLVGTLCVLFGIYIIFNNFIMPVIWEIMSWFELDYGVWYRIIDGIPTLILAMVIIVFGIKLASAKPQPRDKEDIKEFKAHMENETKAENFADSILARIEEESNFKEDDEINEEEEKENFE